MVSYINNIPENMVANENIYELYSLRWKVEILFKCWKSIFKINKNKNMKIQRFRCGLLGSLLSIALSNIIYNELKTELFIEEDDVISELKGFKLIKGYLLTIRISIEKGRRHLKSLIKTICDTLKRKCKKSKQSKKMMAEEKVLLTNK